MYTSVAGVAGCLLHERVAATCLFHFDGGNRVRPGRGSTLNFKEGVWRRGWSSDGMPRHQPLASVLDAATRHPPQQQVHQPPIRSPQRCASSSQARGTSLDGDERLARELQRQMDEEARQASGGHRRERAGNNQYPKSVRPHIVNLICASKSKSLFQAEGSQLSQSRVQWFAAR